MPKKKEKKAEQNKSFSKKPNNATSEPGAVEKERDLYLIQIRHLSDQLDSYQLRCDELESHNKDLMTQHSALQSEKMDVVDYLKHSLAEKEAEADELSERLQHQHQTTQQNTESLQLQHSQLTQQLQDTINTLTLENTSLVERLNSLKEFQEQKETLMTRIEFLEKRLSCQKEEHRDDIHSLEIKALMEKRSQQKEMENHVASMEAEVQLQVQQKVPQTTKVTLQQNVELKTRMNQLSQHVQVLTGENESLREQKSHLSLSVDILEQTLRETSRTSCVRKKVVEHLTEKCQKLQAEQKQWQQQLHQLQSERSSLSTEMKKISQELVSLQQQCSSSRAEERRLQEELQEEKRRRSHMKSILQEAMLILQQAVKEAPSEQESELDCFVRWRKMMLNLLVVVNTRIRSSTQTHTRSFKDGNRIPEQPEEEALTHPKHHSVGKSQPGAKLKDDLQNDFI